jgi:hypothetical protein
MWYNTVIDGQGTLLRILQGTTKEAITSGVELTKLGSHNQQ